MAYVQLKAKRPLKRRSPSRVRVKSRATIGKPISLQQARLLALKIQAEAEEGRLRAAEEEARRAIPLEEIA